MQEYQVKVYDYRTEWFQNGKCHRLDGPAIEWVDGSKYWFQNGKYHRLDGPAIECADGSKYWYQNGKRHRLDGPAVEYVDGYKAWFQNGKYHRLDGPAIEWADGSKEWFIEDECLTESEFNARINPVELTLDEIALKFNIPVSQLKIIQNSTFGFHD